MTTLADIAFGRDTQLSQAELNRRMKVIADALSALEAFVPNWQNEVNALRDVGLERINEALLPAFEQTIELANLGSLLSTTSTSEVEIGVGPKTFTVPEAQRKNFAPTPFLMASADNDFDLSMTGLLSSYNLETGELVIAVDYVSGAGTYSDWSIGPIATTDDLEALRDQVQADAASAATKASEAVAARDAAQGHRDDAQTAKTGSENALATFQETWYGARSTEPTGAAIGSQYLDTSQAPNVVKVLTDTGWVPTVTVAIGGSRMQEYTATEGQTGPFTVDGGFSNGSVNLNGSSIYEGHGVTFDRGAGTFTMDDPLTAGDLVVFEGYLANDSLDIYTKQEANGRFASAKETQSFTATEKQQLRANIGTVKAASSSDTTAGRLLLVGAGHQQLDQSLYRKGNVLGTVSQSGGVPTGALFESGSNANGEYIKFANGCVNGGVKPGHAAAQKSAS